MPFSPSEFNDLLAGLKSYPDGAANEALLIIFMESPIWRQMIARSGVDIDVLRHEVDASGNGFPHLNIEASVAMRTRIDAHFGNAQDPRTPGRTFATAGRLGNFHRFQLNGTALYCAPNAWPTESLTQLRGKPRPSGRGRIAPAGEEGACPRRGRTRLSMT